MKKMILLLLAVTFSAFAGEKTYVPRYACFYEYEQFKTLIYTIYVEKGSFITVRPMDVIIRRNDAFAGFDALDKVSLITGATFNRVGALEPTRVVANFKTNEDGDVNLFVDESDLKAGLLTMKGNTVQVSCNAFHD